MGPKVGHASTLSPRGHRCPREHLAQVTHNLWITDRRMVATSASFDDRFPPALQLFVVRVTRDDAAIAAYELARKRFWRKWKTN